MSFILKTLILESYLHILAIAYSPEFYYLYTHWYYCINNGCMTQLICCLVGWKYKGINIEATQVDIEETKKSLMKSGATARIQEHLTKRPSGPPKTL